MVDITLESFRLLFVLAIVREIHRQSDDRESVNNNGWQYIKYGFWLLLFGSIMDITDNYESLNQYIVIGDTPLQAFFEKVIGYLGGFCCLALGLKNWLPSVKKMSAEISARKASEQKAAELNKKYQFHMSQTPVAFIEWNTDNKITSWNKAAEIIFGYKEQEILGSDLELLFQSGSSAELFCDDGSCESVQFNNQNQAQGGHGLICKWACTALIDELGHQPKGHTALVQDITQAQQDKERLELVIRSSDVGLWEWSCLNNRVFWSDRFYTLLGYNPGEISVEPDTWLTVVHPDEHQMIRSVFKPHLKPGMPSCSTETRLCTKTGEYRWYLINGQAVWDSNGNLLRMAGSVHDINRQKEVENSLIQASNDAIHANQAKSNFLATMSHEIRTPINGIVGMADLLEQSALQPDQKHMINTIQRASSDLLYIINDILDLSKIEANRLELDKSAFSVTELIENTVAILRNTANKKGLKFWLDWPEDLSSWMIGDKNRIQQILLNLISNAIKFTDNKVDKQGEVVVKYEYLPAPDKTSARLSFSISDNGIGIAGDAQEKLFNAFTQAEESTTRRYGGSGLGLAICKELAELMEGDISMESSLGEGSVFRFSVELPTAADVVQTDANKNLPACDFLILYQQPEWRALLEGILSDYSANTECRNLFDPETALISIPKLAEKDSIIVLFTPEWSAITIEQFQSELKQAHREQEIKLIQLAYGSYPERTTNLSCIALVNANPVIPSELINRILEATEQTSSINQAIPSLQANSTSSDAVTITGNKHKESLCLIVEDNPVNQEVLLRQTNLLGYKAMIASDGCAALDIWNNEKIDLILTDYHMPVMDGIELTRKIRQTEANSESKTPIIGITANALSGVKESCLNAGMNDCLTKPVLLSELNRVLNKWTAAGILPVLDLSCLAKLVGDDPDLHARFLEKFRLQAVEILAEIKIAFTDKESKVIRAASHKLKSSAKAVGALQLGDYLQQLEAAAENSDWIIIDSLIENLDKQVANISQYCKAEHDIEYMI